MSYCHWLGTSNSFSFSPYWPRSESVLYIRGQQEIGAGGFEHWQIYLVLRRKQRLSYLSKLYPGIHWEATRSAAAREYVWKEETKVEGTEFELGDLPMRRNEKTDWALVKRKACSGNLDEIPDDVFVRHYLTLRRISQDYLRPVALERTCSVFWGKTGVGKSRRAWDEAGVAAYAKDPLTKWWCGYQGEENVIIDEFRGGINVAHMLRWLDRYPVLVETKGSSRPLSAIRFWITSNLHPREWYPDCDEATRDALMRRLRVFEICRIGSGFE